MWKKILIASKWYSHMIDFYTAINEINIHTE